MLCATRTLEETCLLIYKKIKKVLPSHAKKNIPAYQKTHYLIPLDYTYRLKGPAMQEAEYPRIIHQTRPSI